jgi:transposase
LGRRQIDRARQNPSATDFSSHFTPTYSAWLNQVEVWFSILAEHALKNLSLTKAKELRDAIDRHLKVYNPKAAPLESTKAVVHQVELKKR